MLLKQASYLYLPFFSSPVTSVVILGAFVCFVLSWGSKAMLLLV